MATNNSANVGFEEKLWLTADKMRNHMDAAEYKHVVLGLIFLKYISDSFEEYHTQLKSIKESDPEDRDEYIAKNVFWVPVEARWDYLKDNAKSANIGIMIDDAMIQIEKENVSLKGVLPKNYGRPDLDKQKLGEIIDLISTISLGNKESRSKDLLGRVYEYFLGRFASAEGKGGGEFYTPRCVVKLLVEMLEPYSGRVFDPCCGSGGMFVQSEEFITAHGGNKDEIAIYGQELNPTTWKLCKMNLAIRGINGNIGEKAADSFSNDQHKDLKADFILANPPFNISDWGGENLREDIRWKYGVPPTGNANYAWIQHFIHHLSPAGIAGFVLANGSLSSNTSGEGEIRKNLIENGLVDCIVALPSQLFYTTQIPASLWFVSRDRHDHKFRDRHNEILFIDAKEMGEMVSRKNKSFTDEDINKISATYHNWRTIGGGYKDEQGYCKSATIDEVKSNGYVLTPGRYVGIKDEIDDGIPFEDKINGFTDKLNEQMKQEAILNEEIKKQLNKIGFELK